jgi:hypothetical protein
MAALVARNRKKWYPSDHTKATKQSAACGMKGVLQHVFC